MGGSMDTAHEQPCAVSTHPPRILMLYGSLRERSYSKLLTLEATRLLETMGAEIKIFDLDLKLTPFHGLLIVLREGVQDAQSQAAVPASTPSLPPNLEAVTPNALHHFFPCSGGLHVIVINAYTGCRCDWRD